MVGHNTSTLLEQRNFGFNRPVAQSQSGLSIGYTWQYFFLPPFFDFEFEARYSDGQFDSTLGTDGTDHVKLLELTARIGFRLPLFWERLGLGIAGEYYNVRNLNPSDQFSLGSSIVGRAYPIIDFFPNGFETEINYSIYLKRPLFVVNLEGQQVSIGANIYFPLKSGKAYKYPMYAYKKAIVLNIDYTDLDIVVTSSDSTNRNEFRIKKWTVSLGFNF